MARAANKRNGAPTDEKGRRKNAARRARALANRKADSMPVAPTMAGPQVERQVNAELVPPSPKGGLLEVLSRPYLLRLITQRELAAQYAGSMLGLLWSYVQPALRFVTYYMLMSLLRVHDSMPNFALHLFTGMVVVHYFGETWNGSTRSIWQNRPLVLKMRVPRETFPVAAMVVAAIHTFPQLVVLLVAAIAVGWSPDWVGFGYAGLGLLVLVSFSASLGLIFSALNAMYKDFQNIVATLMQFMHFLVPMMYPFSLIYKMKESNPILYEVYLANPVTQSVLMFQRMFWYPTIDNADTKMAWCGYLKERDPAAFTSCQIPVEFPPDMLVRGLITLGLSLILLWLAQRFFKKFENKFPERL
ncbi:MAG TPA: ABC transporter permease [Marmoricola sp.]|nr:ABC transporter permease [Marmoricola sp.]HNJ77888.1 ABC transporter permease [Marmoricola sp.]HNO39093.1 ABC transporter permease [Marmoricola sp.]